MSRFRPFPPALFAALALCLAGCGNAEKTFGLRITPPNAFDVASEAPLSMPPELGTLPTPSPGEPRPQKVSPSQQAEALLAPSTVTTAANSPLGPGQQELLQQAGPPPPSNIRAAVNREAGLTSKPSGFVADLMFWKPSKPAQESTAVNAPAEQQRLQENAALGIPATHGPTPSASSSDSGFLNRILDVF